MIAYSGAQSMTFTRQRLIENLIASPGGCIDRAEMMQLIIVRWENAPTTL